MRALSFPQRAKNALSAAFVPEKYTFSFSGAVRLGFALVVCVCAGLIGQSLSECAIYSVVQSRYN
jgi:hypothetical protein